MVRLFRWDISLPFLPFFVGYEEEREGWRGVVGQLDKLTFVF